MTNPTWLTQEAYDRLKAELDQLVNVERSAIAKKIQEAREEGDLKENGGYHAAKEQQGTIEARIARLTQILANSVVGEAPEAADTVTQGMVIKVELNGRETEFLLGSAEMADNTDLTVYSPDSQSKTSSIHSSLSSSDKSPLPQSWLSRMTSRLCSTGRTKPSMGTQKQTPEKPKERADTTQDQVRFI